MFYSILKCYQAHGRYGPILKNYRVTYIYQLVISYLTTSTPLPYN